VRCVLSSTHLQCSSSTLACDALRTTRSDVNISNNNCSLVLTRLLLHRRLGQLTWTVSPPTNSHSPNTQHMATTLPHQAPAATAGGQDANSLQGAHGGLDVRGMIDTRAASDEKEDQDQRCYPDQSKWQPVIVYEPTERSKIIVEPHPEIASRFGKEVGDEEVHLHLQSTRMSLRKLKTVAASTLVFQPSPESIYVESEARGLWSDRCVVKNLPGGATFGMLVKAFCDEFIAAMDSADCYSEHRHPMPRNIKGWLVDDARFCIRIRADGAIASNTSVVKIAREASEKAQSYALLDQAENDRSGCELSV